MDIDSPPYGVAVEHDFGQDFNYSVWTPNSVVSLHNVPWNTDYRDIVYYDNQNDLDTYLNSVQGLSYTNSSYLKANEPVVLGVPFNKVYKYNYLRVYNPAQPLGGGVDEPRTFYYFITGVRYLSPQATQIDLQLDVWQTFSRYVKFGRCYIEHGHIGIANEDQFDDHGRTYLTVPEGLDVGNEYVISDYMEHTIATSTDYNIMIVTTVSLAADPGDKENPNLATASGSIWENIPNGCEIYLCKVNEFVAFMYNSGVAPWVTQGIISITAVPDIYSTLSGLPGNQVVEAFGTHLLYVGTGPARSYVQKVADDWRGKIDLPARYRNLLKFKTYPYTVLEMTSYTGNPVILKPECLAMDDLYVGVGMHLAPPNSRIAFYPFKYNAKKYSSDSDALADTDTSRLDNDRAEYLDVTTGIMNLPQFSLVNDGYLGYMASNAHRIAYSYQSADWSKNRALSDITHQSTNMRTSAAYSNEAAKTAALGQFAQNGVNIVRGMGNAALGSGMEAAGAGANVARGSIAGAAGAGVLTNGINSVADLGNAMIGLNAAQRVADIQREGANQIADGNEYLYRNLAQGDYQNEINGINARVQDAHLIQPSTSGQMGGEAFNLVMFKWGVFFRIKTLQRSVMAAIGEYWLRYGYQINRFGRMPDDFRVMEKFTYWKVKETYITSAACPEFYKMVLRSIFEKGVTVWTNPAYIGTIDIADNEPLSGVTL